MEEKIKKYLKAKGAKLISLDIGKGEFRYQPEGKTYEIKGFVSNVEDWFESLDEIDGEKYEIADWWKSKNSIDWDLLQEGEIAIKSETEKALLVTNNAGTELWLPKSIAKRI